LASILLALAYRLCSAEDLAEDLEPKSFSEIETKWSDLKHQAGLDTIVAYESELTALFRIPWDQKQNRRFLNSPLSMRLVLLLTCISRQALDLTRNFIPLASSYRVSVDTIEANFLTLLQNDAQIADFIESNEFPSGSLISLSVGAMAMTSDHQCLLGTDSDFIFVLYAQRLDRRFKCLRLHIMTHSSAQAGPRIHEAVDFICDSLSRHRLVVMYVCGDGDAGYNARYKAFFTAWYSILIEQGLLVVLAFASESQLIPVFEYLPLWKTYCHIVKNGLGTLSPGSFDASVNGVELESILQLGAALRDKSSIGRMRDSCPLQLFLSANCVPCIENGYWNELMYLLPWTLQEEVVRNPKTQPRGTLTQGSSESEMIASLFRFVLFTPGRTCFTEIRSPED
jgi:hypothetical protein